MQKSSYKYYNRQVTTRDNGNVEFHDQEESKLNNTINVNKSVHTLIDDKIISSFNKDNEATINSIIKF